MPIAVFAGKRYTMDIMHLKGIKFGFPIARRIGLLKHHETYRIAWNRHAGVEIHYVLKGKIVWELGRSEQPIVVPGGSFGIIPAKARHRALDGMGAPAIRIGAIFETPRSCYAEAMFPHGDVKRILGRFRANGGMVRRFPARLSAAVHSLAAELAQGLSLDLSPDGQMRLRMMAANLVYETYAALGEPEVLAEGHDVIPQIRKWIDEHCSEDISLDTLVKLSGYGRSRFFSLFLAETGMTPNNYLVRARIERAKQRLSKQSPPDSMLKLAIDCGFGSASAFSSTFRKVVGICPREFIAKF